MTPRTQIFTISIISITFNPNAINCALTFCDGEPITPFFGTWFECLDKASEAFPNTNFDMTPIGEGNHAFFKSEIPFVRTVESRECSLFAEIAE